MKMERLYQPLAPRAVFAARVARSLAVAFSVIGVSLIAGMSGYHHFEKMSWLDAYANAAMILSGMGPLSAMATPGGKIFAGSYALYSGLLLIAIAGVVLTPVLHRFLHSLHIDDEDEQDAPRPPSKVRRS
jgi:hypothetical protein